VHRIETIEGRSGMRKLIATLVLAWAGPALAQGVPVPGNTGNCLNTEEAALVQAVNAYRVQNGKAALPASYWLSTTGQWHGWDLQANAPVTTGCNLHSWSAAMPVCGKRCATHPITSRRRRCGASHARSR
jgi:hypothetical protein